MRHGKEHRLLQELATWRPPPGPVGEIVRRKQRYFASHAQRMNYDALARRGWPIGSGAVESACRQRQYRFKRSGQFWTPTGLRHLAALVEAQANDHWDELWQSN
ncbi:MAG TPA: hypothetical protein VMP11_04510 [Verrucomicrobiae bacterium]|nr:hypothetical protein [Verrucomicrobiae bacterium]